MLSAILIMLAGALLLGALLGFASVKFKTKSDPVVDAIDRILPQTQCGQCDYPGCRPYAEAIAAGEAEINRCPPGGEDGVAKLAQLLNKEILPLADAEAVTEVPLLAIIDEKICIGCTLCIQVCPVDAIVGATKLMHTVIETHCTGCNLCPPVCPVECIEMVPNHETINDWHWPKPKDEPINFYPKRKVA